MTSIQPELWVETPDEAVAFYEAAFGATVLHRVGEGDDVVAQLGVGGAAFWVAATSAVMKRLSPHAIDGATSRTLLLVEDPDAAKPDNRGWSLYGAPWLQPVAISGKSTGSQTRRNKPNRLPPAATSCARRSMVRNAMKKGLPSDTLRLVDWELSRRPVSMLYAGLDLSRKRLDF